MPQDLAASTPLTVVDFCRFIGISKSSFYKHVQGRNAPNMFRVGRRRLIARESALAWIAAQEGLARPSDRGVSPSENFPKLPTLSPVSGSVQGLVQ